MTMGHSGRSRHARSAPRQLIAAALASVALWYIPGAHFVTYPIRLFVTFVHEGAHGLATVATGGFVTSIVIAPSGSGLTESLGGWPSVIYPAGYVGAAVFGAFVLLYSGQRRARQGLATMAGAVLLVTVLWTRNPFGIAAGIVIGLALLAAVRCLRGQAGAFVCGLLSIQLCLNALFDIRSLLWMTARTDAPNDAVFMAQAYFGHPVMWALLWAIASVAAVAGLLRIYWRRA